MSDINLYVPKGCYYLASGNDDGGYWKTNFNLGSPAWLTSVNLSTKDNIALAPCFNNIKVASIIGKDFGNFNASGIALLGNVENMNSLENSIKNAIENSRSSNLGKAVTISSKGGGANKVLISGYTIGNVDPGYNILTFGFHGVVID